MKVVQFPGINSDSYQKCSLFSLFQFLWILRKFKHLVLPLVIPLEQLCSAYPKAQFSKVPIFKDSFQQELCLSRAGVLLTVLAPPETLWQHWACYLGAIQRHSKKAARSSSITVFIWRNQFQIPNNRSEHELGPSPAVRGPCLRRRESI